MFVKHRILKTSFSTIGQNTHIKKWKKNTHKYVHTTLCLGALRIVTAKAEFLEIR